MKKIILAGLAFAIIGCKKEDKATKVDEHTKFSSPIEKDLLSTNVINDQLYRSLNTYEVFNWSNANIDLLWSAAMQSDSIFSIGYQTTSTVNIEQIIHQIDIKSEEWVTTRDQILNLILEGEKLINPNITLTELLPFDYPEVVPSMAVKIQNFETIQKLRAMQTIRYLEPMGYELPPIDNDNDDRSSSGCGASSTSVNNSDYSTLLPNAKQSWHHSSSSISPAWNSTTGNGVTISIIDTGISDYQDNLGSNFNSGYSSGRTVQKMSTLYSGMWWWKTLDAPHDQCGHGTQMAGVATAPRSNDGNAVGIAYNADLLGIRAVQDVYISSSNEKNGVKNALILSGNRTDVKVISMSLGTPFYSGTVADGIYYAYNKGKSIFAAAGTSLSWTSGVGVIFPATMSQTYAVTGVKEGTPMTACNVCHDGSQVEFTMVMERANSTSRHGLTLNTSGNLPRYVGGSSCATASVAGIAALVYANNPGISRTSVHSKLKQSSSNYPNKDSDYGWGIINANTAVNL